ncbi:MAG TPA: pilin [Candidatus Paceibacterota bacterium]
MRKILAYIGVFAFPAVALAQVSFWFNSGVSSNPFLNIMHRVADILNAVVPVVITLALIYFIWGVAKYVTANSDEAKQEARDVMVYGAIGLFFIVSIWGIVALLQQFTGTPGYSSPPTGIPSVPPNNSIFGSGQFGTLNVPPIPIPYP